ncbi:MAG TPA: TolC family protein [Prolixibacteraceae bacterium]|nr:TolC family protein [Prolixibacteraceae bacterium]HRV88441.1 TolC family protein [Prolixibacteraceae bacterium]
MRRLSMVAALMFGVWTGMAQENLVFDLEGAKQQAIQYNKTLKNSAMAIDKAQYQLKEAISAGLPQVSSALDYSNAMGAKLSIRFMEDAPPTEIPIKPTSNFNLQVGQLLFSGPYFVGIELAKLGQNLTEASYEKSEQEILSQVMSGYHLVLMSGELLELLNKNVANLREVYRKTEAVVRVGMMERTDLDQLEVQIAALESSVHSTERQLEMARNMMRLLLGLEPGQAFDLKGNLNQALTALNGTAPGEFSVDMNPDFRLMTLQEKMTQKQIKMEYAAFLPTLTSFYSRTEKILKPDFDMSPKNMIGLNLSIPIFSGGQRMARVRQARVDLETMHNTRALLADQLSVQERQLQFNLKNAGETYLNQVKNLEVARRVYHSLQLKFEQGLISGLELVTADNNYVRAETDYLSSVYQLLQARVDLDTLYGNLK